MLPSAATARRLPDGDPQPSVPGLGRLATERVADRGHAPLLTYYDDTTGERTELSYATFGNWASKTANLIVEELELGRGDRVASLLGNHWTGVVLAFACWKVGCCLVPVATDPLLDATAAATASGAGVVFVREDLLGRFDDGSSPVPLVAVGVGLGARLSGQADVPGDVLPYGEEVLAFGDDYEDPDVTLDDEAVLVLPTDGAAPAGVRLSQGNLLAAAEAVGDWGLGRDDRLLCAQAVGRPDGLALGVLGPFAAGASLVLTRDFEPGRLWRRVTDERATLLQLSPSLLDGLPEGTPPGGLRGALVPAGAATAVLARARERLPVAVGHGLVEATCASTLSPPEPDEQTRAWLEAARGRPVGAVTSRAAVTALGEDGTPVAAGTVGRLAVRGPVVMAGYDGRPDLDEQVFSAGWLATQEQGFTDVAPDGDTYVFVTETGTGTGTGTGDGLPEQGDRGES